MLTIRHEDRVLTSMPVKVEDAPGGLRIIIWRASDLGPIAISTGIKVQSEKPLLLELIETDR